MVSTATDSSRALWRRQLVLTALAVVAFAGTAFLSARVAAVSDRAVAARRLRLPEPDTRWLSFGVALGAVIVVALLIAVCIHAFRIARLTFSPKSSTSETD